MFVQIVAKIYLVLTLCLTCKLLSTYLLILTTVLFAAEETDTERLSQCYLKCRLNKLEPECKSMYCFFHQEVFLRKNSLITKYTVNSVFHNIVNLHSGTNSLRTSRRSLSLNSTGLHNLPKVTGRIRIYTKAFWL